MTVRDALREGGAALAEFGTSFLDASLILAFVLRSERCRIYARGAEKLDEADLEKYRELLALRASGRPLAYIVRRKEFWNREFYVDERVLVPRPETELLVESCLGLGDELISERAARTGSPRSALRVHEPFCGSGCVALSLALERPSWSVSASDISEEALAVARINKEGLSRGSSSLNVDFFLSDILAALKPPVDIILANPPYVASSETDGLLARGWSEPRIALDGGEDGLDYCRRLMPEAAEFLAPGGWLLVEADGDQARELRAMLAASGLVDVCSIRDLAGAERVSRGRKPWKS